MHLNWCIRCDTNRTYLRFYAREYNLLLGIHNH